MFDAKLRRHLQRPLDLGGRWLADRGVHPDVVTAAGFAIGVGACVAVAAGRWPLAIVLWLANRLADGIDGPLARAKGPTEAGGFLDIMADFSIYGGMIVAVGYAVPDARVAALAVFLGYYLSGSAFLAWSSLATRQVTRDVTVGDGRSLHFPAGLAEGAETIVAYVVILAIPSLTVPLLWAWAVMVGITVVQRVVFITANLRAASSLSRPPDVGTEAEPSRPEGR